MWNTPGAVVARPAGLHTSNEMSGAPVGPWHRQLGELDRPVPAQIVVGQPQRLPGLARRRNLVGQQRVGRIRSETGEYESGLGVDGRVAASGHAATSPALGLPPDRVSVAQDILS